MRTMLSLMLILPATGCVIAYGPTAPAPGLMVPATEQGTGDVSVSMGLARNVADRVEVHTDGSLEAEPSNLPSWPYLDISYRQGIAEGLGFEARLSGSLILPFPFPIPNGVSLAPMIEVAEIGDDGSFVLSPRGVLTSGAIVASGPTVETRTSWTGYGLEVPAIFTWEPTEVVALNATPYVRVFWVVGQAERRDDDDPDVVGPKVGWPVWGGGLTANAHLTLGVFRVGLGLGFESGPEPLYNHPCPDCEGDRDLFTLSPQGGLSLGIAW